MNLGDYPQVIAQCRKTLEAIPSAIKLKFPKDAKPTYNEKIEKFLSSLSLPQATNDTLKIMLKELWAMTSKPHHTNSTFNRADAEFVLNIAVTLLAYLGEQKKN